jgi:hypothetical protein
MNLRRLQQLCADEHLDLYYADKSTFSMNPCLPYGWEAKGETIGIVSHGIRKINVFGIFSSANFNLARFLTDTSTLILSFRQSMISHKVCR